MNKIKKIVNKFTETTVIGFGIKFNNENNNSDQYIDYFG